MVEGRVVFVRRLAIAIAVTELVNGGDVDVLHGLLCGDETMALPGTRWNASKPSNRCSDAAQSPPGALGAAAAGADAPSFFGFTVSVKFWVPRRCAFAALSALRRSILLGSDLAFNHG